MADDKTIGFRAADDLLSQLQRRSREESEHMTARRDLERYYDVLWRSREHLRAVFARNELCLIFDACNGIFWESLQLMWAEVSDAIRLNALDTKWSVTEPDDLVRRLRALSPGHAAALADACEQFWLRCAEETDAVLLDLRLIAPAT